MFATLAACTGLQKNLQTLSDADLQKILDDISTIADGVTAVLPVVTTLKGVSNSTANTVSTVVADLKAVSSAVGGIITTTAALPLVQRLEAGIGSVISVLQNVSLPSSVSRLLADAATLLPVVKTAVGLLVPAAGGPQGDVPGARARLRAAAGR
jgi:phage-related protein